MSLFADVSLIYQNLDSIHFFLTWGSPLFHNQKQQKAPTVQHFRVSVQEYRTNRKQTKLQIQTLQAIMINGTIEWSNACINNNATPIKVLPGNEVSFS
jgi:hypothetical protein